MSDEQPRPGGKRRRGRRGRSGGGEPRPAQQPGEERPPGPPGPGDDAPRAQQPAARGPRRDTRGQPQGDRPERGRTHRAPAAGRGDERPRGDRSRRDGAGDRGPRPGPRAGGRDRGPRVYEEVVPQDPVSLELGAKFRETQAALRDARKALDKRRAEFDDEPEWMVEQVASAERAFEEAATAWTDHLSQTGRKVVRR